MVKHDKDAQRKLDELKKIGFSDLSHISPKKTIIKDAFGDDTEGYHYDIRPNPLKKVNTMKNIGKGKKSLPRAIDSRRGY